MSTVNLIVLAAVALSCLLASVTCQEAKDTVFGELDEHMNESAQLDDILAYLGEQLTWASKIGKRNPANGDIINKIASLEARISINNYAIKRTLIDALKISVMENYGQLFGTKGHEQLAESQAMFLAARGILRARATMWSVNRKAWNQVYELARRYEIAVADDVYREIALGLSRDRITLNKDLEVQQDMLDDLLSVKNYDIPEAPYEKADMILDKAFKVEGLVALPDTKKVVPLADEATVASWVKKYVDPETIRSIEEGEKVPVGNDIDKSNRPQDIESFRVKHLQRAGLISDEEQFQK